MSAEVVPGVGNGFLPNNGEEAVPLASFSVLLDIDATRRKNKHLLSSCESLLGIIPGHFVCQDGVESNPAEETRVMVQGLLPKSPALKAGVKIGDWLRAINGQTIDSNNLDEILSMISGPRQQVMLTLQKVPIDMANVQRYNAVQSDQRVTCADGHVQLVSGERLHEEPVSLRNLLHGMFYLRMDIRSDDLQDKEEIVYSYPHYGNQLEVLRGALQTLSHLLPDVTNSIARNSTLHVNNQLVHVAYCCLQQEVLIFCLPARKCSVHQLNRLMNDISRVLLLLYGSLKSAFTEVTNHSGLDHLFALVFQRLILTDEYLRRGMRQTEFVEPFMDILSLPRATLIPDRTKVSIDNCLSDLESADFADMSECYYGLRRRFSILGSVLFYKGYLLASHLHREDTVDLTLYLQYNCILTMCSDEQMGNLVVWREVFPTRRCHKMLDPGVPGYTEPFGRWYMLAISMDNAVLAVLLEAGGCATPLKSCAAPDPYYVDQLKATLAQLDLADVFNECNTRFSSPPIPSLACIDWYIKSSKSDKMKIQFPKFPISLRTSKSQKTKQDSVLQKRDSTGSYQAKRQMSDSDLYERGANFELDQSDDDIRLPGNLSDGSSDRVSRQFSIDSGDTNFTIGSPGSHLFTVSQKKHNLLSMYDLTEFKKDGGDLEGGDNAGGSFVKITSGCNNTLFHYIHLDHSSGIYISPTQQELLTVTSSTHNTLLKHFHAGCMTIHRLFQNSAKVKDSRSKFKVDTSLRSKVLEHGILFECPLSDWHDSKKPAPSAAYWVVGRLMDNPGRSEFYVCFHDSAQQMAVEMAFKLLQGTLV